MSLAARAGRSGLDLARRAAQEIHGAASSRWGRGRGRPRFEGEGAVDAARLSEILEHTNRSLEENVLSFWVRHAPDRQDGGFVTHLDRTGRPFATDKYLVMQTRMIWTLAAAHRHGLTDRGYLDLARSGVDFLMEAFWDRRHGGFFWAVTKGGQRLDDRKLLYGQGFAIYALAEYAMAAGDRRVLAWAETTAGLIEQRAADGRDGFCERFTVDWVTAPDDRARRKTSNTHLHLMEALTTLVEASPKAAHTERLATLVSIVLTRAVHPRHGCLGEGFERDWRPQTSWRKPGRVSYGHEVETAWLACRALDILGADAEPWRPRILGLVDHVLRYGFDWARGGIARFGPPSGDVRQAFYLGPGRLAKAWWQQAEMLIAALEAYSSTRDPVYLLAFEKQFDWVWRYQIDHQHGEWFASTGWRSGKPSVLHKGDDWKCPYHTARALMEVSRRLRALGGERASAPADVLAS